MRSSPAILALLVLVLVPFASAMGEQTVDVPGTRVWVDGQRLDLSTAPFVPAAQGADLAVETKDQEFELGGATCTLQLDVKGAMKSPTACHAEAPDAPTTDVANIVETDLTLRLFDATASQPDALTTASFEPTAALLAVSPQQVMLAVAAASASLAAVYGVWRLLKWTGLAAFLPLYSHLTDAQILDDPNRSGIYRLIQTEPGISTKDVASRLGLAWGTVTHHLSKLEKRRFVVSKKYGKYRRYFANGMGGTDQKDQVAVLRLDRTGDIAALIRAQPGLTQKAVSNALGVSSSTILWHVKRLEGAQLITKVREGKLVRYYPGLGLASVLITPPPAAPSTAA